MASPLDASPSHHWRGRDIAAAVVLLFLGWLVLLTVLVALEDTVAHGSGRPLFEVGLTLALEAWIGIVVLVLAWRRRISLSNLGLEAGPRWGLSLLAVLLAYVSINVFRLVVYLAEHATGRDLANLLQGNPLPPTTGYTPLVWAVLGISVVVVAPLAEELMFRGLIFRAVEVLRGRRTGYVISGLAFGVIHLNLSVLLPFSVIGFIFAWVYRRSGSLWTSVVAHTIVNGIAFILSLAM